MDRLTESPRPALRLLLALLALLAAASSALAIIRVDVRVSAIYDVAKVVVVGKVARIDAGANLVEVEIVERLKGDFPAGKALVQFAALPDNVRGLAVNEPAVIFVGARVTSIHLGDYFLSADPLFRAEPPTYRIMKKHPIGVRFPGRTAAVVKVIRELKAGHSTLKNAMEHTVWRGGIREWGSVLPKAAYVTAKDLTGDGKAEVLIGNASATQLLVNTGQAFEDRSREWGLADAKGKWAVFANIFGDRSDVLVGNTIWINQGDHFTAGPVLGIPDDAEPIGVGVFDATGSGRPDVVFLSKTGELQIFQNPGTPGAEWKPLPVRKLWSAGDDAVAAVFSSDWGDTGKPHVMVARSSGLTRYALDADGGPSADFHRLCGETLESYNGLTSLTHWDTAACVPIDLDGNGLKDFIVFLADGGPTFVNRGFGTFFLSTEPGYAIRSYKGEPTPWTITPGTRFSAGDVHGDKFEDLLIVTEDGKLFELDNTPYRQFAD